MRYLLIYAFLILVSCGYPDIDTVPDFKDVIITQQEAIDLCKLSNSDKKSIFDCIEDIDIKK